MNLNIRKGVINSYLNPSGYVSSIRIAGIPILPPLITEERRKEIQDDRNKAMMIEKRLKNKRNSTDSGVMTGSYTDDSRSTNCHSHHQTSEQNTCNVDDSISDVLEDLSKCSQFENIDDNFVKHAIADDEFKRFLCSNLVKALKDEGRVTPDSEDTGSSGTSCPENLDYVKVEDNSSDHITTKEIFMKDNFFSVPLESDKTENNEGQPTLGFNEINFKDMLDVSVCKTMSLISPRLGPDIHVCEVENGLSQLSLNDKSEVKLISPLVRRNSYVLESPSPALLKHMQDQELKLSLQDLNVGTSKIIPKQVKKPRKLWNQVERKAFLERCKNLHSPILNSTNLMQKLSISLPTLLESEFSHYIQQSFSVDCVWSFNKNNSAYDSILQNLSVNKVYSTKRIPNVSDDAVTLCKNNNRNVENSLIVREQNSPCFSVQNFSRFKPYLDFISNPKVHNQSDVIFNDKQCKEVDVPRESFPRTTNRSDESYSPCSSISLNKFLLSQEDQFSSPPSTGEDLSHLFNQLRIQHEKQLEELLRKQQEEKHILSAYQLQSSNLPSNNSFRQSMIADVQEPVQNSSRKKSLCTRELFPKTSLEKYSEKEIKAASKICAYARGYLTRRLLHTERVQQIIETIRESLVCALNLRAESALKPMDLELNTRLIQQLTSACYDLHDIFSLPAAKRMAIILVDREKKLKKISRPNSASLSTATKRSLYRKSISVTTQKLPKTAPRARARSCSSGSGYRHCSIGLTAPSVTLKRCSSSHSTRQPWR